MHRPLVERNQDLAPVAHPLGHRPAQVPRHEGSRPVDGDVVLLEAVLEGHLDRVPEPLGDEERGLRAGALDEGVGGEGRAVDEEVDLARRDPRRADRLADRRDHPHLGGVGGGQHLGGDRAFTATARLQGDIREGPADIHGETASSLRVIHDRRSSARPCRRAGRLIDNSWALAVPAISASPRSRTRPEPMRAGPEPPHRSPPARTEPRHASHGFVTSTSKPSKSRTARVASDRLRAFAVPAIRRIARDVVHQPTAERRLRLRPGIPHALRHDDERPPRPDTLRPLLLRRGAGSRTAGLRDRPPSRLRTAAHGAR